jgi:hypothetical protein
MAYLEINITEIKNNIKKISSSEQTSNSLEFNHQSV